MVLAEVFKVLEPAALLATTKALAEAENHHLQRLAAFELTVERCRFESERARRQFDSVEPENRLVARTLERTWEKALKQLRRAESDLAAQKARRPTALTAEEIEWVATAGADIKKIFDAPTTSCRERKQLVRTLIAETVVKVNTEDRTADLRIIWEGGATTELLMTLTKTGGHLRTTEESTVDLVRRLAVHYNDTTIAQLLAKQKRLTGTGKPFTKTRVQSLRVSRDIPAFQGIVGPEADNDQLFTVKAAAEELRVSSVTIYRWLKDGFIIGEQLTPGAPWRIRLDETIRSKVREECPEGWLGLEEAANALGVVRQTVLHKVQRGELAAVHVRRGKRKGLRIHVNGNGTGLFDQHQ